MSRATRNQHLVAVLLTGIATVMTVASAAIVDEPSPQHVLREKGLVRSGRSYTLARAADLNDRVAEIERRFGDWKRHKGVLDEQFDTLNGLRIELQEILQKLRAFSDRPPEPKDRGPRRFPDEGPRGPGSMPMPPGSQPFDSGPPPPPPDAMGGFGGPLDDMMRQLGMGEARRQYGLLNSERAELAADVVAEQVRTEDTVKKLESESFEIERRRLDAVALDSELRTRYAKLVVDPPVKLALATLSERESTPLSMTPPKDYSRRLSELANAIKEARQAIVSRMAEFPLKGQNRLAGLAGLAESLLHDMGTSAGRIQTLEREAASRRHLLAEQSKQRDKLSEDLQHAGAPAQNNEFKAQLRAKDLRLETLRSEQNQNRDSLAIARRLVAAERKHFLRIVRALADAIDQVDQDERPSTNEAKAAGQNRGSTRGNRNARPTGVTEPFKIKLREYEKTIRAERIPIDVDKSIEWIDVVLNGKSRKPMVLSVSVPEIRLSARLARELGVQRLPDEPPVNIALIDGRTLAASRGRLDNVSVGPFTLADVDCLVYPETAGEGPSILGGEFLNHFSTKTDLDAGAIVLTEVQVKPIHSSGKTSVGRSASSSRTKKSAPATPGRPN